MPPDEPNPEKLQSAKDWFLRGLDMVVMPITDPARAWAGFKKDVLNMKGGFIILLIFVVGFIVHEVDSCVARTSTPPQKQIIANPVKSPTQQIGAGGTGNQSVKYNSDNATQTGTNNTLNFQIGTNNQFLNPKFSGNVQGQMFMSVGSLNMYPTFRLQDGQTWSCPKRVSNKCCKQASAVENLARNS
jgi:hypothetical protein